MKSDTKRKPTRHMLLRAGSTHTMCGKSLTPTDRTTFDRSATTCAKCRESSRGMS